MPTPPPPDDELSLLTGALFQLSQDAILIIVDGVIRHVNPACVRLFRASSEADLVGRVGAELVAPESLAESVSFAAAQVPGELDAASRLIRARLADGSTLDLEVRLSVYSLGGATYTLCVAQDVTARLAADRALRESREFYRAMFEVNSAVKLLIAPESGTIVDANPAAAALYGWPLEVLRGMNVRDINTADPDTLGVALRFASGRATGFYRFRHRTAHGAELEVEVHTGPVRVNGETLLLSIVHDVTERRALEEQLRQAQKMEAIGRLAGGVAHDFNNLLTVMLGYGELALDELREHTPARQRVEGMVNAANRARDLTRQLLAFGRRQVRQLRLLTFEERIRGLEPLLRRSLGETVRPHFELDPDHAQILADPVQIDQIVLNLAINARDAMPGGGDLFIRSFRVMEPDAEGRLIPWVALEVQDSGVGMPPEVQARMFEPYFTTKPSGEGTGLGLATVFGVVEQSGGRIRTRSSPGNGTCLTLTFPAVERDERLGVPVAEPGSRAEAAAAGGRVLLAEDQAEVRELLEGCLREGGFEVFAAADGAAARALFEAEPDGFDAIVSDVVMPHLSGVELAAGVLAMRPDLPVLLISGDVRESGDATLAGRVGFLQKPFSGRALLDALRLCITRGDARGGG